MRIALAQVDCDAGNVEKNLARCARHIEKASSEKARLIVFPELCDTGYGREFVEGAAKTWSEEDSSYRSFSDLAKKHSICVACGISEKTPEGIYNTLTVFSDDGSLLASYRKTHLFTPAPASEDAYTRAGNSLSLVEIDGVKLGLSICYDLRFPEVYRKLAEDGAKALINVAAWPSVRAEHWEILSRARAIENQCYMIAVDRVGLDETIQFAGFSRVVSPTGEIICLANATEEKLVCAELDFDEVDAFRAKIPALESRREDLFK